MELNKTTSSKNPLTEIRLQLLKAEDLIDGGDGRSGTAMLDELLRLYPNYFAARTMLAGQKFTDGRISEALDELCRALRLAPENTGLLIRIGQLEKALGHTESAILRFKQVLSVDAQNEDALTELAQAELEADDIEQAIIHFNGLSRNMSSAQTSLADAYERIGKSRDAAKIYELLFTVAETPRVAKENAALRLCSLKSNIPDTTLLKYISENLSGDRRSAGEFAKASLLIRQGNISAAWNSLRVANDIKWISARKAAERQEASYQFIHDYCQSVPLDSEETEHFEEITNPIVICGPSRSGKTLAESLIAGFPGVCRGFESDVLARAVAKAAQESGFPQVSDPWHFDRGGRISFSQNCRMILRKRADAAAWLTLTSPANIFHVGAAAQINPRTIFVFVGRNRLDLTARIFASDYAYGHSYSYDLPSLNRYLDWHDSLIECWKKRLNDRVVVTSYEELASTPMSFLDKMAAKLGNEFSGTLSHIESDIGFGKPFADYLSE